MIGTTLMILDYALLLDYLIELGVASSVEFLIYSGEVLWKKARDREQLRRNGWAAKL
jgi:hypothetical protein